MSEPRDRPLVRVLLSSAGRRVALAESFREMGTALDVDVRLIACDWAPDTSAACQLADSKYAVPRADAPEFLEAINRLVADEGVHLVVPTIDTELPAYASGRADLEERGAWVNVGDPASIAICRDKASTARVLESQGIAVPRTVELGTAHEAFGPTAAFDSVVKPNAGSAGRSVSFVGEGEPLPAAGSELMIVQERLLGPEYTVNVFVDRRGEFRCAVPHRRLAVRAGEVEKGVTVRDSRLTELARQVAAALPGLRGVFCFQVIDDVRRGPVVFEINARFGGGYPLAHAAGAPFTRWLLEERLGLDLTAHDDWRFGVTMLRYDDAVFLAPSDAK